MLTQEEFSFSHFPEPRFEPLLDGCVCFFLKGSATFPRKWLHGDDMLQC